MFSYQHGPHKGAPKRRAAPVTNLKLEVIHKRHEARCKPMLEGDAGLDEDAVLVLEVAKVWHR